MSSHVTPEVCDHPWRVRSEGYRERPGGWWQLVSSFRQPSLEPRCLGTVPRGPPLVRPDRAVKDVRPEGQGQESGRRRRRRIEGEPE